MKNPNWVVVFIVTCFSVASTAFADPGLQLHYLADEANKEKPFDAYKKFLKNPEKFEKAEYTLNLRFQANRTWIIIKPEKYIESGVIEIKNWFLDTLKVYFFKKQELISSAVGGDRYPFSSRAYSHIFPNFSFPDGTDHIVIEVTSTGPLQIPVEIHNRHDYFRSSQVNTSLHFLYFGFIILTLLLSLTAYIWMKENIFIYYALSLTGTWLITATKYGYVFQYLWPESPIFNDYILLLYIPAIFNIIFIEKLLNLSQKSKILYYSFRIFCAFFSLSLILWPFFQNRILNELVFTSFTLFPVIPFVAALALRKKVEKRMIRFFILGSASFFIFIAIYVAASNRILPLNAFTDNAIQIGSAIEILFFNLAILNKINIFKQNKEESLIRQKIELEEKVRSRTEELTEKNLLIYKKNRELKNQQQYLEKKVETRTRELMKSNKELNDRNFRLEQFANVTAHNLRGPVATLLGLSDIFNKENPDDPLNTKIIDNVKESAKKVDGILKDLSSLLDHHKNSEMMLEAVIFKEVLSEVEKILEDEIEASKAIIKTNFEVSSVLAVPVYIKNIFYNLISNSLKYKGKKPLIVAISSSVKEQFVCLCFQDNGIGVDINLYRDKIFKPYQRFHLQIEGKGLGLYISKTQIDSMGGEIQVESKVDSGTTFKIHLPVIEKNTQNRSVESNNKMESTSLQV